MKHAFAAKRQRPDARRLLLAQTLATLATMLLAMPVAGVLAAWSALLGGLVCIVPSLYFIWRMNHLGGTRRTRHFVSAFYRAEAGKFGLTVALFAAVFVVVPPSNPIFFFSAYVAAQFMHWLTPWLLRERSPPRP